MKMLVSNHIELCNLLLKEFSPRIFIDQLGLFFGVIQGELDEKPFVINFASDGYLNLSTTMKTREVIDEFLILFKHVMGGAEPLCTYDVQCPGVPVQESFPTIIWDICDPVLTRYQIENGIGFDNGTIIHNLKFHDPNKILLRTAYKYRK